MDAERPIETSSIHAKIHAYAGTLVLEYSTD